MQFAQNASNQETHGQAVEIYNALNGNAAGGKKTAA
jgi:hypothetical protein